MDKHGRNAPCPCGSGQKYKKCCAAREHAASGVAQPASGGQHGGGAPMATARQTSHMSMGRQAAHVAQILQQALWHHQRQDLPAAASLYQQVLDAEPENVDALHLSGVVAAQLGRHEVAVDLIARAIARNGGVPDFYNNLGMAQQALGQLDAAVDSYRRALHLKPGYADAHNNLGNALREQGHLAAAIDSYRQALRYNPAYVEAYSNLGDALRVQGDLPAALAMCREALRLKPDYANGHNALGTVLWEQGQTSAAIDCYHAAIRLKTGYVEAYRNLGDALLDLGYVDEAVAAYQEALRLKPDFAEAQLSLGNAWQWQNQFALAVESYRAALRLKPSLTGAYGDLLCMLQRQCDWSEVDELHERLRHMVRHEPSALISPFVFLTVPGTPAEQLACARNRVAHNSPALHGIREGLGFHFTPAARSRLRIGYLSSDFHTHPVSTLIPEVLERHNRERFEVIGYCIGHDDGSEMRRRIVSACDRFVVLGDKSFVEAARHIYDDGVDILLDLNIYTGRCRPQIMALRPAPVQVSYLGFYGTSGAPYMDYIITDRFATPPDQQPFFSEQFAYLPDCFMPNDRQRPIAEATPARGECGLPETGFVFCSFSNTYKILPAVFDVWMRLLRATPGSVLWLSESRGDAADNLRREARARGVAPERLVFAPKVASMADHLARYRLADLFLDTLPYNAHTTASDALWAGLPVLTCAGETFVSRVAGSLLHAIGLPELITTSLHDYEALALHLARTPAELAALRARLAANRLTTPLFDSVRYTRHLEQAFEQMWQGWLQSREHAA